MTIDWRLVSRAEKLAGGRNHELAQPLTVLYLAAEVQDPEEALLARVAEAEARLRVFVLKHELDQVRPPG